MPRLTNKQYLIRHAWLHHVWLKHRDAFTLLHHSQQIELHAYYRCSQDVIDADLLAHRRKIDRLEPSLGARAGKTFALVQRICNPSLEVVAVPRLPSGATADGKRVISVRALAKPEPDVALLAKAVLALVRQLNREHGRAAAAEHPAATKPDERSAD